MFDGGKESAADRAKELVIVGIVAVLGLLILNPGLGPIGTWFAVTVLMTLDMIIIAILLGLPPKLREWRRDRWERTAIYRDRVLMPQLARLTQRTYDTLYGDSSNNLPALIRILFGEEWAAELKRYGRSFDVLKQLVEAHRPIDRVRILYIIRGLVGHFALVGSFLDRGYERGPPKIDKNVFNQWETFQEAYNALRSAWQEYLDHATGLLNSNENVPGRPARSLRDWRRPS